MEDSMDDSMESMGGFLKKRPPSPGADDSPSSSKKRNRQQQVWQSAVPDLVPGAESCPDAIADITEIFKHRRQSPPDLLLKVRKHLLHLGWEIEFTNDKLQRFRYRSPDLNSVFYSIPMVLSSPDFAKKDKNDARIVKRRARQEESPAASSDDCSFASDDPDYSVSKSSSKGAAIVKRRVRAQESPAASSDDCPSVPDDPDYSMSKSSSKRVGIVKRRRVLAQESPAASSDDCPSVPDDPDYSVSKSSSKHVGIVKRRRVLAQESPAASKNEGIECSCCQTLSNFEAHAGSTNHRPCQFPLLEDGRSLANCQSQMTQQKSTGGCSSRSENVVVHDHQEKGRGRLRFKILGPHDKVCSVCCEDVGSLIRCDLCPSSFHAHCVGKDVIPSGDYFCPSCICIKCGRELGKKGSKQSTAVQACAQCERRFHVGCIQDTSNSSIEGNWFCCDTCKKVFTGLRNRVGKAVPVGSTANLTWNLLRCDDDSDDNSKLDVAVRVMHEFFYPLIDPYKDECIMKDIIFSKKSKLNRLNFGGFYTVVLEDQNEMISAAIVRVFGNKVAEVPLVATRLKYNWLEMCRVLMDELEKMLKELGVVRLVLPEVPLMVDTWKNEFGFSEMSERDRLNFLDYTFLGFVETVVCEKLL